MHIRNYGAVKRLDQTTIQTNLVPNWHDVTIARRFLPPTALLCAFDAAARSQSFTVAARELHLTQSAVSRQIRALEEILGAELFHREKQKVKLTLAGNDLPKVTQLCCANLASDVCLC